MELAKVGGQPLVSNSGIDRADRRSLQSVDTATSSTVRRNADAPPPSTQVSISPEGFSALAAEQRVQAGQVAPASPPVTTPPVSTVQSGFSITANTTTQPVGQATASPAVSAPVSAAVNVSDAGTRNVPTASATEAGGVAGAQPSPASQSGSSATQERQTVQLQQQSRTEFNNDQARNRQDVSPVLSRSGAATYQGVLSA